MMKESFWESSRQPTPLSWAQARSLISVSFAGTDFVANFAFVSWVSGPLVANVGVVVFDEIDRSADVELLAKRMNLRILGVLGE